MVSWNTKPKIAAASGILGLLIGAGMGGGSDDEAVDEAEEQSRALVQKVEADADARIEKAVADAEQSEQAAVDAAVADAVAAEKSKRKRLIKAAVAKAVDEVNASTPEPRTLVDADLATDPRFDTCQAANAAGYGNYRRGTDPEYDWYQDRDGDGFVCE